MSFKRKSQFLVSNYLLNNFILTRVGSIKDLGVTFQSNFRFHNHFQNIIDRAYRTLSFILRIGTNFSIETMIVLFNTLVRSILEYCCVVWSPTAYVHIDSIEKVQKKIFRYLYFKKFNSSPTLVSYKTQINLFHVATLQSRRNFVCINFICELIKGNIIVPDLLEILPFFYPTRQLRPRMQSFLCGDSCSPLYVILNIINNLNCKIDLDIFCITKRNLQQIILNGDTVT